MAPPLAAVMGPPPDPRPTYGLPPRAAAPDWLTLSYVADAGFAGSVKLACHPARGGHPLAAKACATLDETDADPSRIEPVSALCVLLYQPVTATLSGAWHGREVQWTHRFGNTCEMRRATGVLFQF